MSEEEPEQEDHDMPDVRLEDTLKIDHMLKLGI